MGDWEGNPMYRPPLDWGHAGIGPQGTRLPYQQNQGYAYPSQDRVLPFPSEVRRPLSMAPSAQGSAMHHDLPHPMDAPGLAVPNPAIPMPRGVRLPVPCQGCRRARVYCDKIQPCERCRRLNLPCLPQIKKRQGSRSLEPAPWAPPVPPPPNRIPDASYSSAQLSQLMTQRAAFNAMDMDAAPRHWVNVASSQGRDGGGGAAYAGAGNGGDRPWPADILQAASIVQALSERSARQAPPSANQAVRLQQGGAGGGAPSGDQEQSRLPRGGSGPRMAANLLRKRLHEGERWGEGSDGPCLRLNKAGAVDGWLTWSGVCCHAILKLRSRGLVDQTKLDFVRACAGAFRLTETEGGRELLRVMGDAPSSKGDSKGGKSQGPAGGGEPVSPRRGEGSRALSDEDRSDDDDAAGVQWAEEMLQTPHTYTFHLPFLLNDRVSCNAHMGEDIITALELQDIGDDAKVCPAFAPAWLVHRGSLCDFAVASVLAMFGRGQRQEHHAIVNLVRRDGGVVRCLCTQRSFQGPDDGVCRLLALRFWPLKHMFDFRLLPPPPPAKADDDKEGPGGEDGERRHGTKRHVAGGWVEF